MSMPAAASASSSSSSRPKTLGSPPFRRTTRLPPRACLTSRALIVSWPVFSRPPRGACGTPAKPRLPTSIQRACGASARSAGSASESNRTTSALRRRCGAAHRDQVGLAGAGADEDDAAGVRALGASCRGLRARAGSAAAARSRRPGSGRRGRSRARARRSPATGRRAAATASKPVRASSGIMSTSTSPVARISPREAVAHAQQARLAVGAAVDPLREARGRCSR